MERIEQRISEPEGRTVENTHSEHQRENRLEKNWTEPQRPMGIWHIANIYVIRVLKGKKKEDVAEKDLKT